MRASRGWVIAIIVITVLSVLLLIPTLAGDTLPKWWGKVFPDKGINLGLDLRGGIFLLVGVDSEKAVEHELTSINDYLNEELKNEKVLAKSSHIVGQELIVEFYSKEDLDKAKKIANDNFRDRADISEDGLSLNFYLRGKYLEDVRVRAIDQ
ncbi:MAG TPA: hypothetical protein VHC46_00770, partial [Thermodesulfobacteriota bacterium]|nr:hypothetical protein [Thermodesulfobacteriota bacterium]